MVNRYPGPCAICKATVPVNGGELVRGRPVHLACKASGKPSVVEFTFSSGKKMMQNAKGRCCDAPCCGCCS